MQKRDIFMSIVIAIIIIFFVANMGAINNFLSVHTDKTIEFGHSNIVVPEAWNTTDEVNLSNQAKTDNGITNNYTIIDVWDDWPESSITDISNAKFASMESGGFKVLKKENVDLGGINVSKQYYSNPSRDNDYQWDHVGVNYVFPKEDTNYSIEVHYFTTYDYQIHLNLSGQWRVLRPAGRLRAGRGSHISSARPPRNLPAHRAQ